MASQNELNNELESLLVDPEDKGPLVWDAEDSLAYNPRLGRAYPIREGIALLVTSEAVHVGCDLHAKLT